MLNAVHYLAVTTSARGSAEASLPESLPQDFTALVGQAYYALKQTLILDEQQLLRTINFDIVVEHPHKYLLNFAKAVGAKHSFVQLAVSLLNDSIVYTNLSLSCAPADIAAACLHIAGHVLKLNEDMHLGQDLSGWTLLGVDVDNMQAVGGVLLDMTIALTLVT